ncbi:transporter substrate-binding protein [Oharaeibacter diazotrophicus]|uniref:Amino acid/amide ABC transporter substrate-binding protein (HAAT family) n=1 Tax=Oharaeibacter diazotrophicus TaxID=1920512 RepID=A0A4R6RIL3_9HYPH|nr:transporter substrate-binding protein [Oharaeibacter diazotrophicus]TDP86313.1 amino acid/amide ABC transporter substrate-binding protein (HAAT family) [Oharaeibacter diazotrophicus]BBE71744.1 aliphatic amidase expression-regulating protein [Pleomorphomonas sp. SM30]GLS78510.1 hypothetical protein GCM10007904_38470 [Oharaeibacter diazotrophicus]
MRTTIPVGMLFSEAGPYAVLGREAADGARHAIAAVEADQTLPFRLALAAADPAGDVAAYAPAAEGLFGPAGCRHVVGTITSSSRKEVLPVAERHRGLLWYAFPYEGYESSENVVYLGATANQHVVPLLEECIRRYGPSPMLVAPDYVWGWEINRIARALVEEVGGTPAGEVAIPVGTVDFSPVVAEIARRRPSFVLSSLIGPSSHAFVRAYAEFAVADPAFAGGRRPLASCNLTEADAAVIGPAVAGTLIAGVHFGGRPSPWTDAIAAGLAPPRRASSCFASAYTAVRLLAEGIRLAGTDDPDAVKKAVMAKTWETPLGAVAIDPVTAHTVHAPLLVRADAAGGFETLHEFPPIAPDPYLLHRRPDRPAALRAGASRRVTH